MPTPSRCLATLASLLLLATAPAARANNEIFPPLPAAASAINFDAHGFLINGQRTFITSGSIHYARVPRALWRERLLQMKRGGFNTVQTYVMWNTVEPTEGHFDFSGENDLAAFLDTAHSLGMYAVVRVGPYVCAEWEDGGYPNWLRFKPGVVVRTDNPQFLHYVEAYYDRVLPIVAARQVNRGGAVIMVQLENEHPLGWGTEINPYFQHLLDNARRNGIEVPTFFSGLHHGSDPGPRKPEDATNRHSPWYTTEYWVAWYDIYGELPQHSDPKHSRTLDFFDRGTWRLIENGGNGFNYYMVHGGTNFGVTGDNEEGASYDYGTSIGEAGDLRRVYFNEKRTNYFARSFQSILENSDDSTAHVTDFLTHTADLKPDIKLTARTGPAGTAIFLDNPTPNPVAAHLTDGTTLTLRPNEIAGFARNTPLDDTFTLASANVRIYSITRQGNTTTLILDGAPNESGTLHILPSQAISSLPANWSAEPNHQLRYATTIPSTTPTESSLTLNGHTLRVLSMTFDQADHTWTVDANNQTYIVSGPAYLGDVTLTNNTLTGSIETPLATPIPPDAIIYAPTGPAITQHQHPIATTAPIVPKLAPWKAISATPEAAPTFDDSTWPTGQPLDISANGTDDGYGWYRTTFTSPTNATLYLQSLSLADDAQIFLNGTLIPLAPRQLDGDKPLTLALPAHAGTNSLAVLAWHYGRTKYYPYLGPLLGLDWKGLHGPVTLNPTPLAIEPLRKWQVFGLPNHAQKDAKPDWVAANSSGDIITLPRTDPKFHGTITYRITLPNVPGPNRRVVFQSVYSAADLALNGQHLATLGPAPQTISLDPAWSTTTPNILTVTATQSTSWDGTLGRAWLLSGQPTITLDSWHSRSGITTPTASSPAIPHAATYFRTTFQLTPDPAHRTVLRFSSRGLTRGLAYLNGICVGRYPQRIPVEGTLLPEPWLKPGTNELTILDDQGNSPTDSTIILEPAASRTLSTLTQ